MSKAKAFTLFALTWIFFFARYAFDTKLAELNDYASYAVEVIFALGMGIALKEHFSLKFKPSWKTAAATIAALAAGYAVFKIAIYGGLLIPFEFDSTLTLVLLLIVAPILEELLFRYIFMNANSLIIKNRFLVIILSGVVFSLAHFNALIYAPEIVKGFIIYQGCYTFILGTILAMTYDLSGKKIIYPIDLHFLFNLGFYLASRG